ncbi:granulocyte-macrophage colony-stimulating factor receptor subunit alpha-like [Nematolebias whitei]|uniref:granulocyte-macrophage colony-stimulating factor receptor subunit alpha-like n=1 Tax=Nematolebias whitei TaxID=451745 RepID=UPI00189B81AF|nr:granulocyte-macrophage colony-stimulating factor receptor subunit alpha-like [Nematolebias whitei]
MSGNSKRKRTEGVSDICNYGLDEVLVQSSTGLFDLVERTELEETFSCLLYPTLIMNCSWLFHTLEKDAHLSVYIRECENDTLVDFESYVSVEKVGSRSWKFNEDEKNHIVILFNMTRNGKWKVYASKYDVDVLRLLRPPANITALIKDGNLFVAWNLPNTKTTRNPYCFDYQLDVGEQETPTELTGVLEFSKSNAAPTHTYMVRMRTRVKDTCIGCGHWSAWSPTVIVEQSVNRLDPLVIVAVSFGIPMILLAVLLLVRHQR